MLVTVGTNICPNCGAKTYRSRGGKDICPTCGHNSPLFIEPLFPDAPRLYHERTFNLLDKPVPLVSQNQIAIQNFEGMTDIKLPVSFYEWYFYDGNPELLAKHNLEAHAIPIHELVVESNEWSSPYAKGQQILPFMWENQGVCTWAIPLNKGDDPEVLVARKDYASHKPYKWKVCSLHFSQWVYCVVRDHLTRQRTCFCAQAEHLSSDDLRFLRSEFLEGEFTYVWPGQVNYHYSGRWGDVIIWNTDEQADWELAPHEGTAQSLLEQLWQCSNLERTLYGITPTAEQQLKAMRQAKPTIRS